jgi:hypothetical protein
MMTKAERDALTSLVRQRFKLLRHDIEVRKAEMIAELETRLKDQFSAAEKSWNDSLFLIGQARDECNRAVNNIMRDFTTSIGEEWPDKHDVSMVTVAGYAPPFPQQKQAARRKALTEIEAVEKSARHELARAENDLLTELLTGALASEDSRAFMNRIPTASALMVPTSALAALVGPLDDEAAQ